MLIKIPEGHKMTNITFIRGFFPHQWGENYFLHINYILLPSPIEMDLNTWLVFIDLNRYKLFFIKCYYEMVHHITHTSYLSQW